MNESQQNPQPGDPDTLQVTYFNKKTYLAGTLIGAICYGIATVLFFRCMNALFNWKRRGVKWILVAHSAAMFSIVTIYTAINLDLQSISYIDSREFPGVDGAFPSGPIGYQVLIYTKAISLVDTIMFILNNWLADGLLLYRCYIIYAKNCWVIALPCLIYLASLSTGIILIYQGSRPGDLIRISSVQHQFGIPYDSISFALGVLLTFMIVGRLLILSRRIQKAMNAPVKVSRLYKAIVTTLIESYTLYSVAFLLFIGSWASGNPIVAVFFQVWVEVQAIASFLVTLRIANQGTSTNISVVSGNIGSINFRSRGRSTGGDGVALDESPMSSVDANGETRVEPDFGIETTTIDPHHGDRRHTGPLTLHHC